ncbi:MAG: hypothetical protein OEY86_13360 [Nitrospira sp.]|nr:hypothetical protein [Nitrospira sp.]
MPGPLMLTIGEKQSSHNQTTTRVFARGLCGNAAGGTMRAKAMHMTLAA